MARGHHCLFFDVFNLLIFYCFVIIIQFSATLGNCGYLSPFLQICHAVLASSGAVRTSFWPRKNHHHNYVHQSWSTFGLLVLCKDASVNMWTLILKDAYSWYKSVFFLLGSRHRSLGCVTVKTISQWLLVEIIHSCHRCSIYIQWYVMHFQLRYRPQLFCSDICC